LFYGNAEIIGKNHSTYNTGYIFTMRYSYHIWWAGNAAKGAIIFQEVVISDNQDVLCIRIEKGGFIS
jgi:hypothetical protein